MVRKIQSLISRIHKVSRKTNTNVITVVIDYVRQKNRNKITFSEYDHYKWPNQTKDFKDTFLPYNLAEKYWTILNPKKYACLARDKYLSHLILESQNIPTPKLYAYYNPEFGTSSTETCSSNYNGIIEILRKKNVSSFVIKPSVDSAHGQGVVVCHKFLMNDDEAHITKYDGSVIPLRSLLDRTPMLFEEVVRQNQQMGALNVSSINTIRVMTALYPDGSVKIFAAFIKIGRAGSDVDNAGSGGNVDCGIIPESGIFYNALQFDSWDDVKNVEIHPDSKQRLNNIQVDHWTDISAKLKEYQSRIPQLKTIGWDVAITDDGPCIIEINNWWDTTGQLFIGRGWRKEVEDCYSAWKNFYHNGN